jgi:hypothetical protein
VIQDTFAQHKYYAFDVKMTQKPGKMPEDLASFWGGYLVEFKLIAQKRADEVEHDLSIMRREAIRLGEGTRFTIDISRHEYIADKEEYELDGYVIYAYPPDMIVSEKLRAICQQMPEYAEIIQRNGLGNQRARDFLDIEVLVRMFSIDLATERVRVHGRADVRREAGSVGTTGENRTDAGLPCPGLRSGQGDHETRGGGQAVRRLLRFRSRRMSGPRTPLERVIANGCCRPSVPWRG